MLANLTERMHHFLNSKAASLLYTALACLSVSLSLHHYAIPVFILWIFFILIMEKNFLCMFLPMTLLCGFAIRTSGESLVLLDHLWLIVPLLATLFLHFYIHGKRPQKGKMLWAQIAISAALILGGLFTISAKEYFKADALYYVLVLGIGMIIFYLWFHNDICENPYFDNREKLMECLWFLGVFCAYSILDQALRLFLFSGTPIGTYVWSNDICELMLFCIPAAFYYARKNYFQVFVGLFFYGVMAFTASISAIVSGGALVVLCCIYLAVYRKDTRLFTLVLLSLVCLVALAVFAVAVYKSGSFSALFAAEENGRTALIAEAWRNFLSAPLFGVGIGAVGEVHSTFMTINWTHNFIFQILGSMGVVGALAYGYQLLVRARLLFSKRDPFRMACALSYFGLFAISMFQPGEFCPMPYATMAVLIFTVVEKCDNEGKTTKNIAITQPPS